MEEKYWHEKLLAAMSGSRPEKERDSGKLRV